MKEKRSKDRIRLIYYLLVFHRDTDQLAGHVVDINTEGLKLMSREPVETDKVFQFKMLLPDGPPGTEREVMFDAKCVWCKEKVYSDFYGAGFQMEQLSDEHVKKIRGVIGRFGYGG